MVRHGFTLFDTAIGRCGVAWGPDGLLAVQLPEASEPATRARLAQGVPDAREVAPPPADVQAAIDAIAALVGGEARDLAAIALDLADIRPFHRRVYELTRAIAPGATRSYGELATDLGEPGAAQAVAQALGRNPLPLVVPCHRVLAAGGAVGGFSGAGGTATKRRLLAIEGAPGYGDPTLF
ncbi:MAG: methylated-DNA--protein-cysteine methyltransferase [Conexibacter sp.]|nr:methylated-DNA--protein-cysteine methyltransferase [Conexibacter sp.]